MNPLTAPSLVMEQAYGIDTDQSIQCCTSREYKTSQLPSKLRDRQSDKYTYLRLVQRMFSLTQKHMIPAYPIYNKIRWFYNLPQQHHQAYIPSSV